MDITIESAPTGSPLYLEAAKLRETVLRRPLGLVLTDDELGLDHGREHLVALVDGTVMGSISIYMEKRGVVRIKQMAVDSSQRGTGVGAKLLKAAELRGKALGAHLVRLHARRTAEGFYRRFGYEIDGEEFIEQGIPHILMQKRFA